VVQEEVIKNLLTGFRLPLRQGGGQQLAHVIDLGEGPRLGARENPLINAQVLDRSSGEGRTGAAATETKRGRCLKGSAHSTRAVAFGLRHHAIDKDSDAFRSTRTIEGDGQVLPFAFAGEFLFGADFDGVVGPFLDDVGGELALLYPEIPAAVIVGFVHARDDRGGFVEGGWDVNPGGDGEGLAEVKIAGFAEVHGSFLFEVKGRAGVSVGSPVDMGPSMDAVRDLPAKVTRWENLGLGLRSGACRVEIGLEVPFDVGGGEFAGPG
jgi:hypothetical protein